MLRILLGCISLVLYVVVLMVCAIFVLIGAIVLCFIPCPSWRIAYQRHFLQRLPVLHAELNHWVIGISTRGLWDISGVGELKKEGWYMMISNHQSWVDILVLYNAFNHKIPPLKFFMKKELLWQLPIAGIACYALGYPFMSRHSHADIRKNPALKGKDVEIAKQACARLRHFPTTLINFIEGTRFSLKKKEHQQSPFAHLLKPRAGGLAVVLQELNDKLSGVINVVIYYPKKKLTPWNFVCGNFEKIIVRYEVIPLSAQLVGDYYKDRQFRSHFQQWLNGVWKKNDALLTDLKKEHEH